MSQRKKRIQFFAGGPSRRVVDGRDRNETGEFSNPRLCSEEVGDLLPSESLTTWAIQRFVHEHNWPPDSEDAITTYIQSESMETDVASNEWSAYDEIKDTHSGSLSASKDDWLNPNTMLQYSLTKMEFITTPELFDQQLRSMLRQFSRKFLEQCRLNNGTLGLIELMFERLLRSGVLLSCQREYQLALVLFEWLLLVKPEDKRVLFHLQKLKAILNDS